MSSQSRADAKRLIEVWRGDEPLSFDFSFLPDGAEEEGYERCTITPVEAGSAFFVVFNDISQEHRRLVELDRQLHEATDEATVKADFLNNMSHEIRTPLNGILGLLDLARDRCGGDRELAENLEQAGELGKYLLSLVNDILDMSRIESNKVELEHVPFDIGSFARDLTSMFEGTAQSKSITYTVELQDCVNRYLLGDRLRLSQVIANIVSNALKFTPEGGEVSVVIKEMYHREDTVRVMIRVRDTGKGMSPQFLGRIFRPFEQESVGIAGKYGGSGLGMAIADSLVRLMQGEIIVDSDLGKGSEFSVYIPFAIATDYEPVADDGNEREARFSVANRPIRPALLAFLEAQADIEKDSPLDLKQEARTFIVEARGGDDEEVLEDGLSPDAEGEAFYQGMRILVAEDNKVNMKILRTVLSKRGAEVENARDGKEAVELYKSHDGRYYDFILMDIQMPNMDGWEATRQIRAYEETTGEHAIIIALSANAYVEDVRHSKEMGMDGHIGKPIDFDRLETLLRSLSAPQSI